MPAGLTRGGAKMRGFGGPQRRGRWSELRSAPHHHRCNDQHATRRIFFVVANSCINYCDILRTTALHSSTTVIMADNRPKVVSTKPLDNKDSRWLKMVQITYQDPSGKERTWEAMQRTTRPKDSAVDAIILIAVLPRPASEGGPHILLEKQYRAPADRMVIEFPAGLVDAGESAEAAAVRELREETGYVGVALPDSGTTTTTTTTGSDGPRRPIFHGSPATSSSVAHVIHMSIDLSLPENRDPKPQLEDSEFIECFETPVQGLHAELRRLEAEGYAIDGKVAAFAEGLAVAAMFPPAAVTASA